MPEIDRFSGDGNWIHLGFVERERTTEQIAEVDIQSHLTVG